MKLATFEFNGKESWGLVLNNPAENRLWVFEPGKVDRQLQLSATTTNGYSVSMPKFMPDSKWPDTLIDFLKLEDEGMAVAYKLETFLKRFLEQCDEPRMCFCGHALEDVQLKSPIPAPRLMWGLVQNCPTFIRSNAARHSTNLFPQGHQRPAGAAVGSGQIYYHPKGAGHLAYNVELGVVIGKKGRYIPVNKALDYVAGYTVVIDSSIKGYHEFMDPDKIGNYNIAEKHDWYVGATCSWGGKMADAHCTVGPYITTKEEIGNVYDLLVYTKMNGKVRDRSHTAGFLLGIERTIQWYSSFATLYPGDIIHMGTLGTDGIQLPEEFEFSGPDKTIGAEIEKVGEISAPVLDTRFEDWREKDDPTYIHVSPAVRDWIKAGKAEISSCEDWKLENAHHFWTIFKNYKSIVDEGIHPLTTPRFLAAPITAVGESGNAVEVPPRANDLEISVELGVILKKFANHLELNKADDYILGYTPLVSITDSSFDDILIEPTTMQEKGLPLVYGRWADGFNTVMATPANKKYSEIKNAEMTLSVEGIGTAKANVSEYICDADQTMNFITNYITMFPGDVMTLGHTGNRIVIPKDKVKDGMKISAEIKGVGKVELTLKKSEAQDTAVAVNQLKL